MRVNGKTVRDPDCWVDLEKDRVTLDGKPLGKPARVYVLLYKPKGYLTSYRDPEGRPTVYDLIADLDTWVSPVGRLDLDSSGLLLMTNDTDLAERIANPAHEIAKTYHVKAATLLDDEQLERLRRGVELSDGPTRPAQVRCLRDGARHTFLEIVLAEGRNRQVRRMLEAVGSKVLKLVRVAIGPIGLGDIPIGHWRHLTPDELQSLGGPGRKGPLPIRRTSELRQPERSKSRAYNNSHSSKS